MHIVKNKQGYPQGIGLMRRSCTEVIEFYFKHPKNTKRFFVHFVGCMPQIQHSLCFW